MRITYSVGHPARDNRPQLAQAPSFNEYKVAIKALKKIIKSKGVDCTFEEMFSLNVEKKD